MRTNDLLVLLFVEAHLLGRLLAEPCLPLLSHKLLNSGLLGRGTLGVLQQLELLLVLFSLIVHDNLKSTCPFG